ncbi:NAD(P)-dependent dehydrogenase (short-subunit alcohol dehydrogenase family) [Pedobacter sp. W3I1]|uniref:SDR family NAD(P)-dependent oxidoreductase n=1 Tax=Pedobacter sp. W3I1 TaxID=3042291 RepID=UPI002788C647|nr:glucose 1-dehydrogenase [Pedobacter sp. W3I1]MDQ0638364.1 NAD(P)-dependent dehydrogenase (short-subunit alcohol dehydrogenase family) [Pedobacter sp. W3I1]
MEAVSIKVAIVTGGASGLGLAISRLLVDKGMHVVMVGRNEDHLKTVAGDLGTGASYFVCDLSKPGEIPGLIENIYSKFSRIDILVNNAGINMKKAFIEVTDEEFASVLQTNLQSVFSISREVVKKMIISQQGAIVNISSMAAQYGIPKVIAYSAAKTGIEGMTRAMATELSPLGIRVNCVAPGFIKTAMSSKALDADPERKQKVISRTPMGRMGEPKDVAEAVYYLCSEHSSYVTGVVLPVDGGNSIGF